MPESKITIASKYVDLASPEIRKSFGAIKNETVNMAKEFNSMRRSISAHMGLFRKSVKEAMEESIKYQKRHQSETVRHARFLGFEIGKIAGTIGSIRNMMLVWMFALRPLISIIKDSTEAMIQQEDAIKRINFAMGLQGTYSKVMSDRLIKLSESFQKVTRYGDEAVLEVMEKLITIGKIMPTQLERATQATLDFASATGKDLSTSADIIAKAASGYTAQLSRYGIIIDKNISDTKKFDEVLKFVERRMGGRAQADISSFAGKMAQVSNSFGDVKESIGKFLVESLDLGNTLSFWKEKFDALNEAMNPSVDFLSHVRNEIKKVNDEISKTGAEAVSKQKPSSLWFITGGYTGKEIEKAKHLIAVRTNLLGIAEREEQKKINNEKLAEQKIIEAKLVQDKLKLQQDFEEKYLSFQRTKTSFRLSELKNEYSTYKSAFEDNAKALLEIDEWYKYQKEALDADLLKSTKTHADMSVQFMQGAAQGMKTAISDGFIKVIKGEFEGLSDVVINFGNIMIEVLAQMAATKIIKSTFLGSFLGAHTGGYPLNQEVSFGYSKRYHAGGEVHATLLEGEGVVSQKGMRSLGVDNLNKLNRGEGVSGGSTVNNYYIQTIDERSFRERLQQNNDIYTNASVSSIHDNGSLRSTTQRWG